MFLQAYGAVIVLIVASLILGRAICVACGVNGRAWAASMVGFAALMIVENSAIELPGNAVTADVLSLLAIAAATAFLIIRREFRIAPADIVVMLLALAVVSIPFLASGRVGLQGVSLDNDTSAHLLWAEGLRSARIARLTPATAGYPLGPHSLVAALGTLMGISLDAAFTGLLIVVAPLTALAATGLLAGQAAWRRIAVGVFCAVTLLVAAYYGEGAFKETIMAGFLLAFVVHLDQVRAGWSSTADPRQWLRLTPALFVVAGAVYTYSYEALAWYVLPLGIWGALEVVARPGRALRWISRRNLMLAARAVAGILAGFVILLLPVAGQILTLFRGLGGVTSALPAPLGNLPGAISPFEMFGVSLNPDFRFVVDTFHAGEAAAFAAAVAGYGVWWSLRHRRLLLPAAAAGAVLIWWFAHPSQQPYLAAKALVIASPLLMALALRGLLTRVPSDRPTRLLRLAVAIAFCALAGYSTLRSLRDAPVQAPAAGQNLEAFHHLIGPRPVMFLGNDDYAAWFLRDASVAGPPGQLRLNKPFGGVGQAADFDSVDPAAFDRFPFVVTTNSPYNSQPYENFRLIARGRFYELWKRTGPIVPRQVIEPPGLPGALLSCRTAIGRRLRREHGVASIVPTPPLSFPGRSLPSGDSATVPLTLPAGRWEISIQYVSDFKVDLVAPGLQVTMPAYLGRPGPFFAVGSVTGRGVKAPIFLVVSAQHPSIFTSSFDNLFTQLTDIVATRIPDTRQLVPLSQACGRYVDWYRLT